MRRNSQQKGWNTTHVQLAKKKKKSRVKVKLIIKGREKKEVDEQYHCRDPRYNIC